MQAATRTPTPRARRRVQQAGKVDAPSLLPASMVDEQLPVQEAAAPVSAWEHLPMTPFTLSLNIFLTPSRRPKRRGRSAKEEHPQPVHPSSALPIRRERSFSLLPSSPAAPWPAACSPLPSPSPALHPSTLTRPLDPTLPHQVSTRSMLLLLEPTLKLVVFPSPLTLVSHLVLLSLCFGADLHLY